jgi:membrane associated rhomboid family serine protease
LGAVAGGLVGAALLVIFYFVGVFVVGALAGAVLLDMLGLLLGFNMPVFILIVAGIVAGVAALFFQRYAIVAATALSGAWAAVGGLFSLISGRELALRQVFDRASAAQRAGVAVWIVLGIWLALSIAGAAVQLRTTEEPE